MRSLPRLAVATLALLSLPLGVRTAPQTTAAPVEPKPYFTEPTVAPDHSEIAFASGGGGLTGTAADYMRFARMLLNGGELDGVRLLSPKTLQLMTANHLRGDLADMGQPRFSEST